MQRCQNEFCARGLESKHEERTRDEQLAQRRVGLPVLLVELSDVLNSITTAEDLTEFTRRNSQRLSVADFHCFVQLMTTRHGVALVRQAGLPITAPRLRVA